MPEVIEKIKENKIDQDLAALLANHKKSLLLKIIEIVEATNNQPFSATAAARIILINLDHKAISVAKVTSDYLEYSKIVKRLSGSINQLMDRLCELNSATFDNNRKLYSLNSTDKTNLINQLQTKFNASQQVTNSVEKKLLKADYDRVVNSLEDPDFNKHFAEIVKKIFLAIDPVNNKINHNVFVEQLASELYSPDFFYNENKLPITVFEKDAIDPKQKYKNASEINKKISNKIKTLLRKELGIKTQIIKFDEHAIIILDRDRLGPAIDAFFAKISKYKSRNNKNQKKKTTPEPISSAATQSLQGQSVEVQFDDVELQFTDVMLLDDTPAQNNNNNNNNKIESIIDDSIDNAKARKYRGKKTPIDSTKYTPKNRTSEHTVTQERDCIDRLLDQVKNIKGALVPIAQTRTVLGKNLKMGKSCTSDTMNLINHPLTPIFKNKVYDYFNQFRHLFPNTRDLDLLQQVKDIDWMMKQSDGVKDLKQISGNGGSRRHYLNVSTPFLYFGRKGMNICLDIIEEFWPRDADNKFIQVDCLVEPFCGSAQFALIVASMGLAKKIHLNDKDPLMTQLIQAVIDEPQTVISAYEKRYRMLYSTNKQVLGDVSEDSNFLKLREIIASVIKHSHVLFAGKSYNAEQFKTKLTVEELKQNPIAGLQPDELKTVIKNLIKEKILKLFKTELDVTLIDTELNNVFEEDIKKIITNFIKDIPKCISGDPEHLEADIDAVFNIALNLLIRKFIFRIFREFAFARAGDDRVYNNLLFFMNSFSNHVIKTASVNTRIHKNDNELQQFNKAVLFMHKQLVKTTTVVTNVDYAECIRALNVDKNSVVFLDPPYFGNDVHISVAGEKGKYRFNLDEPEEFKAQVKTFMTQTNIIITVGPNGLGIDGLQYVQYKSNSNSDTNLKNRESVTTIATKIHHPYRAASHAMSTTENNNNNQNQVVQMETEHQPVTTDLEKPKGQVVSTLQKRKAEGQGELNASEPKKIAIYNQENLGFTLLPPPSTAATDGIQQNQLTNSHQV